MSTGGREIKAFHAPKKLFGSFDADTNKFMPSDDVNFFVLPDGEILRSCFPLHVC